MIDHTETTSFGRALLGTTFMEASWQDIKNAILPLNIERPPKNWGTTTRGKLSTDQWDMICLYFLPITSIRIWGYALTNPETDTAPADDGDMMAFQEQITLQDHRNCQL